MRSLIGTFEMKEHLNNYWTGNRGGNRREYCENSNIVTHQSSKRNSIIPSSLKFRNFTRPCFQNVTPFTIMDVHIDALVIKFSYRG